jgi:DNA-binding CsgD family transcriptional regulator
MSFHAGVPWAAIHDYLLDVESAENRNEFLSKVVAGIERLIPWDTAVGVYSASSAEYLFGRGLGAKANQEYNSYYRLTIPFLRDTDFPLSRENPNVVVNWTDWRNTEFSTDFSRPNGFTYSLARPLPGTKLSLSFHRSAIGGSFSNSECQTLSILNHHLNNLYLLFDRYARSQEEVPSMEELADRFPLLSKREAEVLMWQSLGLSAPEIATKLFVSERTIESHMAHIYEKIEVHNKRDAISKVLGFSRRTVPSVKKLEAHA